MDVTQLPAEPIVFVATRFASDQRCVASVVSSQRLNPIGFAPIVSSHRMNPVAFVETSWTVRSCTAHPVELTCGIFPLATVSYADGGPASRMSERELVRCAGQNQIDLWLSSPCDRSKLPLFLTTGRPQPACYYRLDFRLLTRFWAASPDFLAHQAFWIRHYQKEVAAGREYLRGRLDDYRHERELASQMEISSGDAIPVKCSTPAGSLSPGCLLITQPISTGVFNGVLGVLGEQDLPKCQIERVVKWEEDGEKKEIACVVAQPLRSEAMVADVREEKTTM